MYVCTYNTTNLTQNCLDIIVTVLLVSNNHNFSICLHYTTKIDIISITKHSYIGIDNFKCPITFSEERAHQNIGDVVISSDTANHKILHN